MTLPEDLDYFTNYHQPCGGEGKGQRFREREIGTQRGNVLVTRSQGQERRWGDPRVLSPTPPHILLLSVSQGHALGRVKVSSPKVEVGRTAERTL